MGTKKIKAKKPSKVKFKKPIQPLTFSIDGFYEAVRRFQEAMRKYDNMPRRKYVTVNMELFEENPQLFDDLRWLLETHGGGLEMLFDVRAYAIVDEGVPDIILDQVKNMLDGYPTEIRELNMIQPPQGGWKPSKGRGTFSTYGRGPSVRKMRIP